MSELIVVDAKREEVIDPLQNKLIEKEGVAKAKTRKEKRLPQSSPPIFLMIGSMSNCSRKDAVSYVKGLAEKTTTSHQGVWFYVEKDHNLNRFNFEIHEGGSGYSVLEKTLNFIELYGEVSIELAGQKSVIIEETQSQLHSLLMPDRTEIVEAGLLMGAGLGTDAVFAPPTPAQDLMGAKKMTPLFVDSKAFMHMGLMLLGVTLLAFFLSLCAYVVANSSLFDSSILVRAQTTAGVKHMQDNPLLYMHRAKDEAKRRNGHIKRLYKENGQWRWEIG